MYRLSVGVVPVTVHVYPLDVIVTEKLSEIGPSTDIKRIISSVYTTTSSIGDIKYT